MAMLGNRFTVTLTDIQCCNCHVWFGIDSVQNAQLLERGGTFYCTNGHGQSYTTPEVVKLKQRVKSLEVLEGQRSQQLQAERYQHAATKGKLTKFKNRVAAGVCPCCNRTFQNLNRHMVGQHPEFSNAE